MSKHPSAVIIFLLLSSTICHTQTVDNMNSCIETRHRNHDIIWVCTGDTLKEGHARTGEKAWLMAGFWITRHEVTQELWNEYMNVNPSSQKGDTLPVTGVTKEMVDTFCANLSRRIGMQWRLPTLDEWSFAYHGGLSSEHYSLAGSNNYRFVAWCRENSRGSIHTVGELIQNELRLCDMAGNAAEMVVTGDSVTFAGGSYLDTFGDKKRRRDTVPHPILTPSPPPETRGFRIICPVNIWFDIENHRVFTAGGD